MAKNIPIPSKNDLERIITMNDSANLLVTVADAIGAALNQQSRRDQLSTSQIRAIFGEVRRIEGDWKINKNRASRNLTLLKPKMAYRAKKENNISVKALVDILTPAIDLVEEKDDNFTRFVDFFEAILAYHKAYGGN